MDYHTDLSVVFAPFMDVIDHYNWILSDLEFNGGILNLPVDHEREYFILSPTDFKRILEKEHLQTIWGVVIGVPKSIEIHIEEGEYPGAENAKASQEGHLQYPGAEIEIICFDSTYTIAKFANEDLSNRFKAFFGDKAIPLKKFTDRYS